MRGGGGAAEGRQRGGGGAAEGRRRGGGAVAERRRSCGDSDERGAGLHVLEAVAALVALEALTR